MTTALLRSPGDPTELRLVFGCHPSGVVAVCGLVDDWPVGLAAASFTPVSLDPPLVSVCIQHTSTTWPRLRDRPRLGLSVLAAQHEKACRALSGPAADRFTGLDWTATEDGAVVLPEAGAVLECAPEREVPAGDHVIVLLRVHRIDFDAGRDPLVFHGSRFRSLHP